MDNKAAVERRNWKCFFGMHQTEIIERTNMSKYSNDGGTLPYKRWVHIISRCVHCGKIESGDY